MGLWLNLAWGPPAPKNLGPVIRWFFLLFYSNLYPSKHETFYLKTSVHQLYIQENTDHIFEFWYKYMIGSGEREGGVVTFTIFAALFRVLKHLNHFKAIK